MSINNPRVNNPQIEFQLNKIRLSNNENISTTLNIETSTSNIETSTSNIENLLSSNISVNNLDPIIQINFPYNINPRIITTNTFIGDSSIYHFNSTVNLSAGIVFGSSNDLKNTTGGIVTIISNKSIKY